jgi:hypothetical protein
MSMSGDSVDIGEEDLLTNPERLMPQERDYLWRERILHVLRIYPRISPSMLQVGIGPAIPASVWKPVMEQLIMENLIRRETIPLKGPSGRDNSYTILSLVE